MTEAQPDLTGEEKIQASDWPFALSYSILWFVTLWHFSSYLPYLAYTLTHVS